MINLNFTEKELETLQEYFQSELYKAEQKIDSIRGILDKIGKKYGNVQKIDKKERKKREKLLKKDQLPEPELKERKRPGRKPKVKTETDLVVEQILPKRRGRPPIKKEASAEVTVKRGRKAASEEKADVIQEKPKRGRKPSIKTALQQVAASEEVIVVKRKPGRKPAVKTEVPEISEVTAVVKERRKTGRKPAVKTEVPVVSEATVVVKERRKPGRKPGIKIEKPEVKVEMMPDKPRRGRKPGVKIGKPVDASEPKVETEKPKRGRKPSKNIENAEAIIKTKVEKKPKAKAVKKVEKKKELKGSVPKIPWGDWILNVIRDNENNLTLDQILSTIALRLRIGAEDMQGAERKVREFIGKLMKSKKILLVEEGDAITYALKITGRGI
ncbi:MAG: hypothetical protein NTU44_14690 [Bacteroidetes bacterium]|nr:hypothetical protein [Bacteroidota bacterium]